MIPDFDARGLLPPGVWDCTLEEIEQRFCWNDHRLLLWDGLRRFIREVYEPLPIRFPLWVDGSFCRRKTIPSDIDVVLDVSDFEAAVAIPIVMGLRLQHDKLKGAYNLDVWPRHPLLPNDLSSFFQYVGDKAAAELRLRPQDPKGILRVSP